MHRSLAGEVANVAGFRFSSVRIGRSDDGLVCAVGSHDEPVNTVGLWETDALKSADWLVEHKGYIADGSVTSLEFLHGPWALLLWVGTSRGSLR